jgi:4-diphosphocytidyl-2-C-methyl-D-erythritol kinase
VIFETDHRVNFPAIHGIKIFNCNCARVFNLLNDPVSWGQKVFPRIVASTPSGKIVLSFGGVERATAYLSAWKSDVCELNLVIDGIASEDSRTRQEHYWTEVMTTFAKRLGSEDVVTASSPAKVNIYFAVGALLKDGFHEVASCYQGLNLREKVLVELTGSFSIDFAGPYEAQCNAFVPRDKTNLVYKAGAELAALGSKISPDMVSVLINKSVPIAGGMAGGSADAAAALVAFNELGGSLLDEKLEQVAAGLGSDVPFALTGGTAIGLGRGEKLSRVPVEAVLHWVITPSSFGLATPDVYRKLDVLRVQEGIDVSKLPVPEVPQELTLALQQGDPVAVAELMQNDLERAALALKPELAEILEQGRKAGSLRSMVSGSGPTVIHLAKNRMHAQQIATRLQIAGLDPIVSYTSHAGTRLEG